MQNVVIQKLTCKGGFAAGVYLSEVQNLITPPPLHTEYVYKVYLFTQGRGEGGELNQREGATDPKAGAKIPT